MRKIILQYGLLSGTLITVFTLISMYYCYQSADMKGNMLLGFAAMFLSFSLMFPAIKKYRDGVLNGRISFGQAFLVGIGIAGIASTMYVIGWMIEYHTVMPDFLERFVKYSMLELEKAKLSPEMLAQEKENYETYRHNYDTLPRMALVTYLEILPPGILLSLLAAFIMKKKPIPGSSVT
jgi:hypothetical protein